MNLGIDTHLGAFPDDQKVVEQIKKTVTGHLSACNPVTQKEERRVQYPGRWNGGVLSTSGNLVFQSTAGGIYALFTVPLTSNSKKYPINRSRMLTFKLDSKKTLPKINEELTIISDLRYSAHLQSDSWFSIVLDGAIWIQMKLDGCPLVQFLLPSYNLGSSIKTDLSKSAK